ncbi:hypothetical protein Pan44_10330 [Caulifigura coniformis]|uniref:CopG-like ribbon-helix-helix domain-containing protein n=2 Tax=Caulifigura coniformis TaxID=2527983 RepID=A0A517SA71_9PLAN|nr:hypothetical protein Pan44_10330 [Caulifigura coniformis]
MTTKGERINLRVTDAQLVRWEAAAKKDRRPLADWMRLQLDDSADRALEADAVNVPGASAKAAKGRR